MAEVWTLARWIVHPGREAEFIEAWTELAQWTLSTFPNAKGTLLRDRDATNEFFSFGPWADAEEVGRWRGSTGFRERVSRIQSLLERFEPHALDPVVHASQAQTPGEDGDGDGAA